MRIKRTVNGVTVNAIAGTHVVTLAMDLTDAVRANCLGFAIHRTDHTEGDEAHWLTGMKKFDDGIVSHPEDRYDSEVQPYQTFQWGDYSAKPSHSYTYRVVPVYGPWDGLQKGTEVSVDVQTETEDGPVHSVYFNRGHIASQEYVHRFQNRKPEDVANREAFIWLSRGLFEAWLRFIGRAVDSTWGLRGAVYEWREPAALDAIKAAMDQRGVADIEIVYDGIKKETRDANDAAIDAHGIRAVCTARRKGKLMHNKFFILLHNGVPQAVWTGSMNFTENGIYGHSNVGHVINDQTVAAQYLAYREQLKRNEVASKDKAWMGTNNSMPPANLAEPVTSIFSPQVDEAVLEWYAKVAGRHTGAGPLPPAGQLFMTFPFGINAVFQDVFLRKDDVLRFALLDKTGPGVQAVRNRPNVFVAIGNFLETNLFDTWVMKSDNQTGGANVMNIHTKYMLLDPLGANPTVLTGSANFSGPSTDENHENMMMIRGDQRVADIYVGEFMRLYAHHVWREVVKWELAKAAKAAAACLPPPEWKPQFLDKTDAWQSQYYKPGHQRLLRRKYFAQT